MLATIQHDTLRLGNVTIRFERTLRIPDDGRTYPLPPGLGQFPLRRVEDYAHRVPAAWRQRGGIFLPMYQREAMWLAFEGSPHALKVGVGKVCAISGERWTEGLRGSRQNYVVTGEQPWLDGIATGAGTIRQFVAMPLGLGYTVEAQLTGEETFGGLQLQAFAPKPGRIDLRCLDDDAERCLGMAAEASGAMGLAAGGTMTQKIYPDPHGLETWDLATTARVFVHIVNSDMWRDITGEAPPPSPVSARTYSSAGLPWFALYDETKPALPATAKLASVRSVKQLDTTKSTKPLQDDRPVDVPLLHHLVRPVRDGDW
jgi:hypothetical protein